MELSMIPAFLNTEMTDHIKAPKKGVYFKYIKRPMEFILSLLALFFLSPVFLVVAILVRIRLGSPIIFKQIRPGKDEKLFTIYKFRTLTTETDGRGNPLPDEQRLTKFGQTLRSTSLDELPELWNIVCGDMGIIGPRPQLVRDMVFMTDKQRKRHIVRPGLSGLAQVNGRNCINWEDKFEYDLSYMGNITFLNDWKLILQTIGKVLKKESINTDGMATAADLGDYLLDTGRIDADYYAKQMAESSRLLEQKENHHCS